MEKLNPPEIRYIKLGRGGKWVDASLDRGEVHFGFKDVSHRVAQRGSVADIRAFYVKQGRSAGVASRFAREVLDFYRLPSTTLWITFARDRLWWCFASEEVVPLDESLGTGSRMRRTVNGWHDQDVLGRHLPVASLSSHLTKTAAFRATICKVEARDYLLRRLNGEEDPQVSAIARDREALLHKIAKLIKGLHWKDFEILVDLTFSRLGWQRVSLLGETMVDVDLVLEQPLTRRRAVIQVKSKATQSDLDEFGDAIKSMVYDHSWFVVHSNGTHLRAPANVELWLANDVARAVERAGLVDWLIERCR